MRRPPRPRFNPLTLAGWSFADMLLVLAMVAMGDRGDPVKAAEASRAGTGASPRPDATPGARPSPTPSGPRSVERRAVTFSFDADSSDTERIVGQLRAGTKAHDGRTAAFVLTFGRSPRVGDGVDYARHVNALLAKARPAMFTGATTRDFFVQGSSGDHADIEIYFYTY
ncbi:hypothetical protein OG914_04880 [Streptomyces sp. NBC_00291]|uniref:hypothetical protein n=1 Tax=Streptomyces sp. NBC_00291 TaxID=2975704 RepID=UPI00224E64FB|nr:hypothetical protein [Streptomyces sp. NBC_00291]MCX5153346.1 hypothetical protein [Streptomyces sp. NBC_00291]